MNSRTKFFKIAFFVLFCICIAGCGLAEVLEESDQAKKHGRDTEKFHKNMEVWHEHQSNKSTDPESKKYHDDKASYHDMKKQQERDDSKDKTINININD